ncbi:MAG TPA: hypothetical protein VF265_04405 [Nevskiaceae bacterium]
MSNPVTSHFDAERHPCKGLLAGVVVAVLLTLPASWPVRAASAPDAPAEQAQVYRIQLGALAVGATRITWQPDADGWVSDALVHIGGMLDQRQRLYLDASGLPRRYVLDATVQGHRTHIDVRREPAAIAETVRVDGRESTTRFASSTPVDWLDNNSFDTLQALLRRNRARLVAGTRIEVFVPQARRFGWLAVDQAKLETTDGERDKPREILDLRLRLTVGSDTVPIALAVDPRNATLLEYRQPRRDVEVVLTRRSGPVP